MRIELSVIEKIEQYLMGSLSAQDKTDFEHQMQQSSDLKSQVDFQDQLMRGIQTLALKKSTQQAFTTYKLRRLFIALGFGLALATTLVLSIYFSRLYEPGSGQQNHPEIEESSVAVEEPQKEVWTDTKTLLHESIPQETIVVPVNEKITKEKQSSEEKHVVNEDTVAGELDATEDVSAEVVSDQTPTEKNPVSFSRERPASVWVITRETSKTALKIMAKEIREAGGSIEVKNMRYNGKYLVHISFVVMNKNGEVSYDSGDLLAEKSAKICIRLGEKTISAGNCSEGEELNEFKRSESSNDMATSNTVIMNDPADTQLQKRSTALMCGTAKSDSLFGHYSRLFRLNPEKQFQKVWKEMNAVVKKFEPQ
jgi:hypothetical protein